METSFTELRNKEVINVLNGRLLGNVCDVIMNLRTNRILGFMVPGSRSFFSFFRPCQEIFIPFHCICKIGQDVILVEVVETNIKKCRRGVKTFDLGEVNEGQTQIFEMNKEDNQNQNEKMGKTS